MSKQWTDNQRRAISTPARDACVAAGAGSGKTGVLVARFVRIVRDSLAGKLPPEQQAGVGDILVITFTEKATKEMKARIVAELDAAGLKEQRRQAETAYISTIHGFCSRLLQENPFEAGVDPAFQVLDEVEARRVLRGCIEAAVADAFARGETETIELVAAAQDERRFGLDGRDPLAALSAAVEALLARMRGSGWRQEQVLERWQGGPDATARACRAPVASLLREVCEELAVCRAALSSGAMVVFGPLETLRRDVLDRLASLIAPPEDLDWGPVAALLSGLNELATRAARAVHARSTGTAAEMELQSLLGTVRDAASRARDLQAVAVSQEEDAERQCHRMLGLVAAAWSRYDEAKRARGVLDNEDLQSRAVWLLESVPGVLRRCRSRFRHVLVDEFQDTNPLQMRLVDLLHPRGGSPPASDTAEPNALFLVGDSQQSIYGFRDADSSLFRAVERQALNGFGEHITMAENFRSRPEILAFVNYLFGQMWAHNEIPFVRLVPAASHTGKPGPSVELMVAQETGRAVSAAQEAFALADRIDRLVRHQEVRITDAASPRCGEPVRFGDIAVLMRALTRIEHYERAFAAAGVPYFVVGGGRGYYARHEVRDILNVLTVIDTPLDNLAVVSALRSPMAGLDVDTLYALSRAARQAGDRVELYTAIPGLLDSGVLPQDEAEGLARFHTMAERLRARVGRDPVGVLLEKVLEATDYDARLLVRPNGRRRLANVRKLLQMACSASVVDLADFIRRLRELERIADREGDAPTEEEAADVVRFMTIHKAKGLEFPVVFLADMARGLGGPDTSLFTCDGRTLAMGCRMGSYQTLSHRAIAAARQEADRQESERLLYVAVTRAREHLVLSGTVSSRHRAPNWADAVFRRLGVLQPPAAPEVRPVGEGAAVLVTSGGSAAPGAGVTSSPPR